MTLAAMIGEVQYFTHIGHEETFAAMVGKGNVLTKSWQWINVWD